MMNNTDPLPADNSGVSSWATFGVDFGISNTYGTNVEAWLTNTILILGTAGHPAFGTNVLSHYRTIFLDNGDLFKGRDANSNLTLNPTFTHPPSWYCNYAHSNGVHLKTYLAEFGLSSNLNSGTNMIYFDTQSMMTYGFDGEYIDYNTDGVNPAYNDTLYQQTELNLANQAVADWNLTNTQGTNGIGGLGTTKPFTVDFGIPNGPAGNYGSTTCAFFPGAFFGTRTLTFNFSREDDGDEANFQFGDFITNAVWASQNRQLTAVGHNLYLNTMYDEIHPAIWSCQLDLAAMDCEQIKLNFSSPGFYSPWDPLYTNYASYSQLYPICDAMNSPLYLQVYNDPLVIPALTTYSNAAGNLFIMARPLVEGRFGVCMINWTPTNAIFTVTADQCLAYPSGQYNIIPADPGDNVSGYPSTFTGSFSCLLAGNSCALFLLTPLSLVALSATNTFPNGSAINEDDTGVLSISGAGSSFPGVEIDGGGSGVLIGDGSAGPEPVVISGSPLSVTTGPTTLNGYTTLNGQTVLNAYTYTSKGIYYLSNSLSWSAITSSIPPGGGWIGMVSNVVWSVKLSNNVVVSNKIN